jgi:hypothetical protein
MRHTIAAVVAVHTVIPTTAGQADKTTAGLARLEKLCVAV